MTRATSQALPDHCARMLGFAFSGIAPAISGSAAASIVSSVAALADAITEAAASSLAEAFWGDFGLRFGEVAFEEV